MKETLFYFAYRKEGWAKGWYQLYNQHNELLCELQDHQWWIEGQFGKNQIVIRPKGFWMSVYQLKVNDIVQASMQAEKWWSIKKIVQVDGLPDYRLEWKTSYKSENVLEVSVSEKDNGLTRLVFRKERKKISAWKLKYYWKIDADERLFESPKGYWLLFLAFTHFASLAKGEEGGNDVLIPGKEED